MTPTKAEKRRWSWASVVGCIACQIEGDLRGENRRGTPPDVHHETQGHRTGHDRTAFLCPWHHRGVIPSAIWDNPPTARYLKIVAYTGRQMGASLAIEPEKFRARYGADDDLIRVCDLEIDRLEALVI